VLHYTGMPTAEGALALLVDPAAEVSAHYFVWESGEIAQLVAEDKRAWHAGIGQWGGLRDLNSASIGIEIVNPGHDGGLPDFPQAQIDATIALLRDIAARRAIRPERVLAHSDLAPARKRDLASASRGTRWRWRASATGSSRRRSSTDRCTVRREGPPVRALQALLALYGYGSS